MPDRPIPNEPKITAVMLYYGRKALAEEAVESFLRQTYMRKRLLIINTHPDPIWFEDDYPNIEVHNIHPDPFDNLNEKYNYAFQQIRTPWWCPWDSDDIWLPWHFANFFGGIPEQKTSPHPWKIGLKKCYFSEDNEIDRLGWNMWTNCMFETFDHEGNQYPRCDPDKPEDNCDGQILYTKWDRVWLTDSPKSFIFRWSQAMHGSAYTGAEGLAYQAECRKKMYAIRNSAPLRPHWNRDYIQDVADFKKKMKQTVPRRKVLFDLGGHIGETIRRFHHEVDDAESWEIHTFEPYEKARLKLVETIAAHGFKNVTVSPDAITGTTGQKKLYVGAHNDGEGSTLVAGKTTGAIDYSKHLHANGYALQNCVVAYLRPMRPEGQYAVLKMNIEGGEYELMEHILEKNLLKYFDQIYIQTHKGKLDPANYDERKRLEERFRAACLVNNVELFMQDKGRAVFSCSQR